MAYNTNDYTWKPQPRTNLSKADQAMLMLNDWMESRKDGASTETLISSFYEIDDFISEHDLTDKYLLIKRDGYWKLRYSIK